MRDGGDVAKVVRLKFVDEFPAQGRRSPLENVRRQRHLAPKH
jgi:hypothetical protein